jgi:hypothetical protein
MRGLIRLSLLAAALLPRAAQAQRTWPASGAGELFGLEVGKGVYRPIASSAGPGFVTGGTVTLTESALIPIGSRLAFSFELPFSRLGVRVGGADLSATKLGNPWIGIEATMGGGVVVEAGFRPGIIGEDTTLAGSQALGNGVAADYDHYEAWLPGYHTARAGVAWSRTLWRGFFLGATAGASLGIPNGATDDDDHDMYVLYGVRAGWRDEHFYSSVALIGRGYPTATGPASEGSVNQLAFDAGLMSGWIRPDASFRVYLDRLLKAQASATFSVGFTVAY